MKNFIIVFLMGCLFAWPLIGYANNIHPSRAWTEAEKKVFKEALREWDTNRPDITFTEEIDCNKTVDFTVRWEDKDFFKNWDPNHNWSDDLARFFGEADIPPGWGVDEKKKFPFNEIYFRSDITEGWFIDPDPNNDNEFFLDGANNLRAKYDSQAFGHYDLLTHAKHEIGHILLGPDHTDTGIMHVPIPLNIRVHPTDDEIKRAAKGNYTYKFINPVPEPATILLLCFGLISLVGIRKKFRK